MTLTRTFANGQTGHLADMASIVAALDAYDAINAQTATTYTLVLGDISKLITVSNGSAVAVSIPTNAAVPFPVGYRQDIVTLGVGQPTISAASPGTTTVLSTGATPAAPKLRAQYSGATLVKIATDTWLVMGDIS